MKIRTSFVANSSSSSFVVFGIEISDLDSKYIIENKWGDEDLTDEFQSIMKKPLSYGGQYTQKVGITIDTLLAKYPEIKLCEIKKVVADEINKQFNTNLTDKDISFYEEGWYDG